MFPRWPHEVPRDGRTGLRTVCGLCVLQENTLITTGFLRIKECSVRTPCVILGRLEVGLTHLPLLPRLTAQVRPRAVEEWPLGESSQDVISLSEDQLTDGHVFLLLARVR